jgi:UDP-N-acetylglucosamine 4-epimerase
MKFTSVLEELRRSPKRWLVTGCAGFIGSHFLETLLSNDQEVVGIDNFSTGYRHNLEKVAVIVGDTRFSRFTFHEGNVADPEITAKACKGVYAILHQGALGSVPRSIDNPVASNHANVTGFLQMATSAKDAGVKRMVYASSSSVYGDNADLPKVEEVVGNPLSPYAVTKMVNELYARVFAYTYSMELVGLRYFNVFGPRQNPNGAYAAVIPKWIGQLLSGQECTVNGDGETSRDFCYIKNVVQANILAAMSDEGNGEVFNVACGDTTTLKDLYAQIIEGLIPHVDPALNLREKPLAFAPFRQGDIRHSLANTSKIKNAFGYEPQYTCSQGLIEAAKWYAENLQ